MNKKLLAKLANDQPTRIALAKDSHEWFFGFYFHEYIKHPSAPFHKTFFDISEDTSTPLNIVMAFRNSAKSSILTTSYPIWAILGKQQCKFVLLASLTQAQARGHLTNIRRELEANELLRADLGPFHEESDEWGSYSLVLPRYNARITAVSAEQAVRGLRHLDNRPELIICDDVEDISSVKSKEGRKKTFDWFSKELLPAGDENTRTVIVGNLLHPESLLMRYISKIDSGEADGKHYKIPLVNELDEIAWKSRFPDMKAIDKEKRRIGDKRAWAREYLLKILPDEDQVVHRDWIKHYPALPDDHATKHHYKFTAISVDPAISIKSSADFTAIVSAHVFILDGQLKIYILPNPVNLRILYPEIRRRLKEMTRTVALKGSARLIVEDVAFQAALPQDLREDGFVVDTFHPHGSDKRERLSVISYQIKNGTILFPKSGAKDLIEQIVGFESETHDDLSDALCALVFKVRDYIEVEKNKPKATFVRTENPIGSRSKQPRRKSILDNDPHGWPTKSIFNR